MRLAQLTLAFLVAGTMVRFTVDPPRGDLVWGIGLVVTGAPVVWRTLRSIVSGHFATDLVATLAIVTSVEVVEGFVRDGERVLMVGDGTNDAPALSAATVGIALAGHGGGITAEAADVVILNDDLSRVVEAIQISRRTVRIARESIWTGLGLSGAAMLIAAMGYIRPAIGALLQEVIDVAVILNALRTSRAPTTIRAAVRDDRGAEAG